MSPTQTILTQTKAAHAKIFRRAFIKRRDATTGLFESNWQDVTKEVKRWGNISRAVDSVRLSKVRFSPLKLLMANDQGLYNPETSESSRWFGFANRQRTLVKIEAGFLHQTLGSNGVWTNTEFPSDPTVFIGLTHGDMSSSDRNTIHLNCQPLLQVFRDYPARNIDGYTSTGLTASQFMTLLRDQTDGSGGFVFRPFFGDTTTNWDITATSQVYANLNSALAEDIKEIDCWTAIEKLAEAEQKVAYVSRDGVFKFRDRNANTTGSQWSFFGRGFNDGTYGHTIKKVSRFGPRISNFYTRVEVKWTDSGTTTAVQVAESTLAVSGTNLAWNYGLRTFRVANLWIPDETTGAQIATTIFNDVSAVKNEIDFETTFVPQLELLDRVDISYDSSDKNIRSVWDVKDWADDPNDDDLYWDDAKGDAVNLVAEEFKLVEIRLNLDRLSCRFRGRET